ncbi:pantothenate kinase [Gregarina niphandrodes]|uniref:Pantothenate kinase n=1 Tax=Gregarina niphandrodes TaxID=110365 RepID=A0A023BAY0_GRENI|nr:pantothenate kinase [Gregarina niphandrodes]EZG78818.1 pantothenate kinase [Gregarina niphandrodes]|eukprot:XP_011129185.1 pantothenate kinase [Gregarina niphandrodes]
MGSKKRPCPTTNTDTVGARYDGQALLKAALYKYLKAQPWAGKAAKYIRKANQDIDGVEPEFKLDPLFAALVKELDRSAELAAAELGAAELGAAELGASKRNRKDVVLEESLAKLAKLDPASLEGSSQVLKPAPMKRLNTNEWLKKSKVKDNSYEAKGGDGFASRAAEDLGKVKGKDFRAAKNKKKRASWKGAGSIDTDGDTEIHFIYFETCRILELIEFIKPRLKGQAHIHVSGGGAYKFHDQLSQQLGVKIVKCDEMSSVVCGLIETLEKADTPLYQFDLSTGGRLPEHFQYPLLVVNIGSGVSILKVNGADDYSRISGTCIGGGTALGLCKLYFGTTSFEEVVELSRNGKSSLDLTVIDLVGDSAGSTRLPPDLLSASFGRLHNNTVPVSKEDFAFSAIRMVSYNLGYLGYLLAKLHGCQTVIYGGKYVSDHDITMATITEGMLFSQLYEADDEMTSSTSFVHQVRRFQKDSEEQGKPFIKACFLRHDGYLGAIGVLSKGLKCLD